MEHDPMVRLKGPGLGTGASGSLSDALIFSSNKGRAYLKKGAKPKQPQSPSQVTLRVQMAFLSREWKSIWAPFQDTWASLATKTNVSPFNAYQAYNLTRARNHQRATMPHPAMETGNDSGLANYDAWPGPRCIHTQIDCTLRADTWSLHYWFPTAEHTQPLWNQLIHIQNIYALGTYKLTIRNITPGTYWFSWTRATTTGRHSPTGTWRQIVVPN